MEVKLEWGMSYEIRNHVYEESECECEWVCEWEMSNSNQSNSIKLTVK